MVDNAERMIQNLCSSVKKQVCPQLSTVVLVLHTFAKSGDSWTVISKRVQDGTLELNE